MILIIKPCLGSEDQIWDYSPYLEIEIGHISAPLILRLDSSRGCLNELVSTKQCIAVFKCVLCKQTHNLTLGLIAVMLISHCHSILYLLPISSIPLSRPNFNSHDFTHPIFKTSTHLVGKSNFSSWSPSFPSPSLLPLNSLFFLSIAFIYVSFHLLSLCLFLTYIYLSMPCLPICLPVPVYLYPFSLLPLNLFLPLPSIPKGFLGKSLIPPPLPRKSRSHHGYCTHLKSVPEEVGETGFASPVLQHLKSESDTH